MWREEGNCRGFDFETYGDIWFESEGDEDKDAMALAMCSTCPVRYECLQEALNPPERTYERTWAWGTWGGLLEDDLRKLLNELDDEKLVLRNTPCPYCKIIGVLKVLKQRRTQKKIECDSCGLTWWSKVKINVVPVSEEKDEVV